MVKSPYQVCACPLVLLKVCLWNCEELYKTEEWRWKYPWSNGIQFNCVCAVFTVSVMVLMYWHIDWRMKTAVTLHVRDATRDTAHLYAKSLGNSRGGSHVAPRLPGWHCSSKVISTSSWQSRTTPSAVRLLQTLLLSHLSFKCSGHYPDISYGRNMNQTTTPRTDVTSISSKTER